MSNEKIRIAFASFPDYSGNSKALYESLKERNISKFELVWFIKDKEVADKLNKLGIKSYYDKDENFMKEFDKAKLFFTTHEDYMRIKKPYQIMVSLWHGLGPKTMGYGTDSLEQKKWVIDFNNVCDYIITDSEFAKALFTYRFNRNTEDILIYPQARYKYLKTSDGKGNLSKLLGIDVKKYDKIFMYAPTFRTGIGRKEGNFNPDNLLNLEKYDETELQKYLKKNNYLLVLKMHPSEERKVDALNKYDNIKILKDKDMLDNFISLNETLNGIDLLITDYSSIYTDYINLLRPVIFLFTDYEDYSKDRSLTYDSDNLWFPGPKVTTIKDFLSESDKLLNDPNYYKDIRIDFNKLANGKDNDWSNNKFIDEFILKQDFKKIENRATKTDKQIIKDLENEKELLNTKLLEEQEGRAQVCRWLEDATKTIKEQEQQIAENQEELNRIHHSLSYRIVRKIKRVLKKIGIKRK